MKEKKKQSSKWCGCMCFFGNNEAGEIEITPPQQLTQLKNTKRDPNALKFQNDPIELENEQPTVYNHDMKK